MVNQIQAGPPPMLNPVFPGTSGSEPKLKSSSVEEIKDASVPSAVKDRVEIPKEKTAEAPAKMQEQIQAAVEHLNQQMMADNRALGFSIDETINRHVVTVKNTNTGEVVRTIPTDAVLKFAHNLEAMKGLLHNELI